ncbi:hypothetical protein [Nocardiopsis synnemataformans]|uniref:hypothetical protein n=1 Tax=Nocardiopsis synnemataformans TaxID=61305 RepID=UPI003EB769D5
MATNAQLAQQAQDSMRSARRLMAIVGLATGIEWTTATGAAVRVEPMGDTWCIRVDGVPQSSKADASAAVDLAARLAPPADRDLEKLLTWTACGHARV